MIVPRTEDWKDALILRKDLSWISYNCTKIGQLLLKICSICFYSDSIVDGFVDWFDLCRINTSLFVLYTMPRRTYHNEKEQERIGGRSTFSSTDPNSITWTWLSKLTSEMSNNAIYRTPGQIYNVNYTWNRLKINVCKIIFFKSF